MTRDIYPSKAGTRAASPRTLRVVELGPVVLSSVEYHAFIVNYYARNCVDFFPFAIIIFKTLLLRICTLKPEIQCHEVCQLSYLYHH